MLRPPASMPSTRAVRLSVYGSLPTGTTTIRREVGRTHPHPRPSGKLEPVGGPRPPLLRNSTKSFHDRKVESRGLVNTA